MKIQTFFHCILKIRVRFRIGGPFLSGCEIKWAQKTEMEIGRSIYQTLKLFPPLNLIFSNPQAFNLLLIWATKCRLNTVITERMRIWRRCSLFSEVTEILMATTIGLPNLNGEKLDGKIRETRHAILNDWSYMNVCYKLKQRVPNIN